MQILPAIDIKNGRAVRLYQGDFNQETVVNESPLTQAEIFAQSGVDYIHVVDLDGALDGQATNAQLIAEIKAKTGLKIEVGGGIRSIAQIEAYLQAGIDRVIIGSMAVKSPDFVSESLQRFGSDKIVVGIDAKAGMVATEGWLEVSDVDYLILAKKMEDLGVRLFVYTDVDRDGTLAGPNFEHYQHLIDKLDEAKVIASGGVHAMSDLVTLEKIGVHGVIVGKAYYSGAITLSQLAEF
ncbi:MAG: 1-(5-phosphoribosyl)-5-[(5-phosphoribosylamino)methylideneamino]imidazole-4-carboxamide isomerase [Streptococcaceae bacterium]|jgi:phosphoribosylformimino-5-aminoimidazole carboxamide ribotide isomerase|nr:1-(5-phosphoribosyl)-5-[(5-phosphoribosylamino)methylideneamino]imidazole-4-carboxamide isomerase [Streptococcaceae bacterium]MCH4176045.1 1-(5-phosphoribosyl)-5-[(5-phosphoribosylamino)methylideneamino]imidazole-4-carboxamide isomerase [Streptococcaceae bacterium]